MTPRVRRFLDFGQEYKPGLILVAVVLLLGFAFSRLIDSAPRSEADLNAAINRVYNLAAQPVVCLPAKAPPTR